MVNMISIFIIILIVASLFPVAFTVIAGRIDSTCYPIPSFTVPLFKDAYAWSYYFNTTNNRWYNHTQVTVNDYNSTFYEFNAEFPSGEYVGNLADGANGILAGQKVIGGSTLEGQNITAIQISLWKRLNNPVGTATVGIFNPSNGAMIDSFGTIDVSTLNSFAQTNYTFVNSQNYTLQAGDLVGIKYDPPSNGDNYIQVSFASASGDNDGVFDIWTGSAEFPDIFSDGLGKFFSIHYGTTDGYTLIPLTGHAPNQTNEGRDSCAFTFENLWLYSTLGLVAVMFILIRHVKENR